MSLLSRAAASLRCGLRLVAPSRPLWHPGGSVWRPLSPSLSSSLHSSAILSQRRGKGEMRIAVIGQSLFGQEVSGWSAKCACVHLTM